MHIRNVWLHCGVVAGSDHEAIAPLDHERTGCLYRCSDGNVAVVVCIVSFKKRALEAERSVVLAA